MNNAHVRSRSSSKKRRIEDAQQSTINESVATTVIEETIVGKTVKFEKCQGFQAPFEDSVYFNFPFQTFGYNDHDFVFENGNFHSKKNVMK